MEISRRVCPCFALCKLVWLKNMLVRTIISKNQCAFREGYNTQECLIALIKNKNQMLTKEIELAYFSKTFGCLPHKLLVTKLHTYGFSLSFLPIIYSYLAKRKQRTKTNEDHCTLREMTPTCLMHQDNHLQML